MNPLKSFSKSVLLLLCCCGFNTQVSAQWTQLLPLNDTTVDHYGMHFLSASTGFLSGHDPEGLYGVIRRTTNGGDSWDTTRILYPGSDYGPVVGCIHFVTDKLGFVGARDGKTYRTVDGGENWRDWVRLGMDDLTAMWSVSDSVLYIKTVAQKIRSYAITDTSLILLGIWAWNDPGMNYVSLQTDSSGFVAGGANRTDSFHIYHFDRHGGPLTSVFSTSKELLCIKFRDSLNGYAVGVEGAFTKTSDGGKTWSDPVYLSTSNLYDVHFVNDSLGFTVGGCSEYWPQPGCKGYLYVTVDGGKTWKLEFTSEQSLKSIDFPTDSIGYISGHLGQIYKTTVMGLSVARAKPVSATLFPNPCQGRFQLRGPHFENIGAQDIKVFNALGQEIDFALQKGPEAYRISLLGFTPGIHYLQCKEQRIPFSVF